jgi:glycerol-3-phosphate acyltransferase PlsY
MTTLLAPALFGYLLGSLPFAVVVSKAFGLADPRSFGSGNPGATNVLRSGNKLAALLTLLGDALKGWLAVRAAGWLGADGAGIAVAGLGAFLGHVFSVFLRFRGGKGVATAFGVLTGFHPIFGLAAAATWLIVALVTRYSSLAAIVTAIEAPFAAWVFSHRIDLTAAAAAMSALLVFRHKTNIKRLIAGTEMRIGGRKTS